MVASDAPSPTQRSRVRTALWATLVVAAPGSVAPARAAGPPAQPEQPEPSRGSVSLDALLGRFADMPGLYAEFIEEKHLAMLAQPLVNEGTIHFADGAFARHVTAPNPSSLVVARGRLTFADGHGRDELDLDSNPVAALFVQSFTKILAGDAGALERMYRMELHATGLTVDGQTGWKLDLRPRVSPLSEVVELVEVMGHGVTLDAMRIVEVGGDETITTFRAVDTQRRYTRRERRRIFRAAVGG